MSETRTEATGAPLVKFNGASLPEELLNVLLDVRIELPLSAPAQATLRFFDADYSVCDDAMFQIATEVEIMFPNAAGEMRSVFVGDLVALATEVGANDLPELLVTCYDHSHRMSRSTTPATYLRQSYADIIRQLAQAYGMRASVDIGSQGRYEYLLQTSDAAAFLNEMLRRTGAQWKVVGKELKAFVPPLDGVKQVVTYGEDLLRFRSRFSGIERNDQVAVHGWDPMSKKEIVANDRTNPEYLSTAPMATNGRSKVKAYGKAPRQTGSTVVVSAQEAQEVAKAYRSRSSSVEVRARGETRGNPSIVPGTMITVKGVGTRLTGDYYVSEVEHVYNASGHVTRFSAGTLTPTSLVDLVGGAGPSRSGPMIGLVTNINDPDGLGRVKVMFPAQGENVESEWARLAMPGAGADSGLMLLPSINDEVLVMFEQGDTRRPLIIGAVWNGKDRPPIASGVAQKGGRVKRWGLKTRSGHTLTFIDDDASSGRLEIAISDSVTKLVLGKERVEVVANSKDLELKSGKASVLLSKGQDVVIKGGNVTIEATTGSVKINGLQIEAAARTKMALSSGAAAELKANGTVSIAASGITEVKGAMVKIN